MLQTGIEYNYIKGMFLTLSQMKHKIQTGYGVSKKYYKANKNRIPIQGIGQGNAMGPIGWGVISSPLFETMRKAGFGTEFIMSISKTLISLTGYGFVDNVDIIQTNKNENKLIEQAEEATKMWEGCLKATGRALSIEKSFWYGIAFSYKNKKWIYKKEKDMVGEIKLKNKKEEVKIMERKNCHNESKTLGVYLAPDGTTEKQTNKLISKANVFADKIQTGNIKRNNALHAL